jgi:diguanylate cyclase (GGDEF)-like protein
MSGTALRRWLFPAIAALASLAPALLAAAGISGVPIAQRIGPADYRASPGLWSVAAAPGKLYVASADGVLIYDGVEWSTVPLPVGLNATIVRRLPDDTVMVGGNDTYGRLEHDDVRGYRYVDLLASSGLPDADRRLGPVWEIVQTPEGIYVQSQNFIHLLPANGGMARSWPVGPDMRSMMAFGGDLYARVEGRGLGWMRGGELHLVPQGETFARQRVSSVVGWGGSRFVVAGQGVWRLDDSGVTLALAWPDGELPVYVTAPLDSGGFILATLDGEVLVVDAGLRIRQRVRLTEQTVADLARDDEGMAWAVTDTEVVRLGIPSPWSIVDRSHGLRGMVVDTTEFDGATWVSSSRGVFRLNADGAGSVRAEGMPWATLEGFGMMADERALLVGEREGLRQLLPGSTDPITLIAGESVYAPTPVKGRDDLATAWSDREFLLLRFVDGAWRIDQRWPLEGMSVFNLIEPTPGEFWLGDDRGAPQRWRIDLASGKRTEVATFGAEQGLPIDGPERPNLFLLDGVLMAWSKGRTYSFDPDTERFQEIPTPEWIAGLERPGKLSVVETTMGHFAVTPLDLLRRPATTMAWQRVQIGGWASTGFGLPRVTRGGVLRIPVWNGILQYAPEGPVAPLPPLAVGFDQLLVEGDDGVAVAGVVDRGILSVRSGQPLRMRFSLGTLEPGARFRYRLDPVVADFGDWADRDLAIRGLDPGEYLLEVEGLLPSGRTIEPMRVRVLVGPRWFEEPALRGLLGLLVIGGVFWASRAVGRRRVSRVEAQNRQLEQRIADRTLDLERANARLAEMAVEDPLTGAQNRRALEQALAREWARCGEQGLPLAALMIDVDHFKRFNDHHGHLEGDRVLVDVATLLRTELNAPVELLARYGGEEFTLLLPGTTSDAATRRAELLRDTVERARAGVTISIGVAVSWPGPKDDASSLLRRADQALYEAKRLGRNRVVCADA